MQRMHPVGVAAAIRAMFVLVGVIHATPLAVVDLNSDPNPEALEGPGLSVTVGGGVGLEALNSAAQSGTVLIEMITWTSPHGLSSISHAARQRLTASASSLQ